PCSSLMRAYWQLPLPTTVRTATLHAGACAGSGCSRVDRSRGRLGAAPSAFGRKARHTKARLDLSYPDNFPFDGQWTSLPGSDPPSPGVYAVSVAGVRPTTCTSWFLAAQACRLASGWCETTSGRMRRSRDNMQHHPADLCRRSRAHWIANELPVALGHL